MGIGTTSPLVPIHIYASQNSDIKIEALSFQIAGKTYIPNFQHMGHQGAGQYSNGNFGGQLFIFDIGLADVYNDNNDRAIWFKPDNENIPSAGVYISKGKYNGFSVGSNPTAKIDIGGSIRLRESQDALITGSDCTGRNGEIGYFKGHFYGCKNNSWVQMDN